MGICNSREHILLDDDDPIRLKGTPLEAKFEPFDIANKVFCRMKAMQNPIQINSLMPQTIPIQITIDVDRMPLSQRSPVDIILLVDCSLHMSIEKQTYWMKALENFTECLGNNDRLCIIGFNDDPFRLTHLARMNVENKQRIINNIKDIKITGSANISKAMKLALDVIDGRREANKVTSIFLLSSDYHVADEKNIKKLLSTYISEYEYTINTFGVGNRHNPALMEGIAHQKNGHYYFIDELHTIDESFTDCLGGLITAVGDIIELSVKAVPSSFIPDLKITKAYGLDGKWNLDHGEWKTSLVYLISGKAKNFILELEIPPTKTVFTQDRLSITIASAQVSLRGLDPKIVATKDAELVIDLINPSIKFEKSIDGNVLFNYYRVRGAELIKAAKLGKEKSNSEEAETMLIELLKEMHIVGDSTDDKEDNFDNLILDLEEALNHIKDDKAQNLCYLVQNHGHHMEERSNIHTKVQYGNKRQNDMVNTMRLVKSKTVQNF